VDGEKQGTRTQQLLEEFHGDVANKLELLRLEFGHKLSFLGSEQQTLVTALADSKKSVERLTDTLVGERGVVIRLDRLEQAQLRQQSLMRTVVGVLGTVITGAFAWIAHEFMALVHK
jgi:hypothetical protein